VDPQIAERVLARSQATRLRDPEPLSLDGARERFGTRISDEELLLRLTMPAEQVDAMVEAEKGERPASPRPGRDPLVRLLDEVSRRRSITYLRLVKGDDVVEYRRAGGGRAA
jgi:oxaloacetate decarboxylase alpha subunit